MKRGEVYLCPLGRRDGGQERLVPVVVLTRDAINQYAPVVVVAPVVESEPSADHDESRWAAYRRIALDGPRHPRGR